MRGYFLPVRSGGAGKNLPGLSALQNQRAVERFGGLDPLRRGLSQWSGEGTAGVSGQQLGNRARTIPSASGSLGEVYFMVGRLEG